MIYYFKEQIDKNYTILKRAEVNFLSFKRNKISDNDFDFDQLYICHDS